MILFIAALFGLATSTVYEIYKIFKGILFKACMPIAHAVYKPNTVDLADPLGANMSTLGPAIPLRHSLSSPVHKNLCH